MTLILRLNYPNTRSACSNPAAELPRFALDFPNYAIELLHFLAELPTPGLFHETDLPFPRLDELNLRLACPSSKARCDVIAIEIFSHRAQKVLQNG